MGACCHLRRGQPAARGGGAPNQNNQPSFEYAGKRVNRRKPLQRKEQPRGGGCEVRYRLRSSEARLRMGSVSPDACEAQAARRAGCLESELNMRAVLVSSRRASKWYRRGSATCQTPRCFTARKSPSRPGDWFQERTVSLSLCLSVSLAPPPSRSRPDVSLPKQAVSQAAPRSVGAASARTP